MTTFAPTRTTMIPPVWQTAAATDVDKVSATTCPRRVLASPSPGSNTISILKTCRPATGFEVQFARAVRMPADGVVALVSFLRFRLPHRELHHLCRKALAL